VANPYGFKASFNASFPADRRHAVGWVSPFHFGINEGPTVVMIENHRTGMPWTMMRSCVPLVTGLRRAGFTGGWLDAIPHARDAAPAVAPAQPAPFYPPRPPEASTAPQGCPE